MRCRVLLSGPYFCKEHYIHLERWSPDFDPENAVIASTMTWIPFPTISVEYFDESAILEAAKLFGRPIKVNQTTAKITRAKFARVCVEIDLSKQLVSMFWLRDKIHRVQYEGLPTICYGSARVGHRDTTFPKIIRAPPTGNILEQARRDKGVSES